MRLLIAILLVILVQLQFRLWVGDGSLADVFALRQAVEAQRADNERRQARNAALEAEVLDLRQGEVALEERARTELGMIREGETFFQIVPAVEPHRVLTQTAALPR